MNKTKLIAAMMTLMIGTSVNANTIAISINDNAFDVSISPVQEKGTTYVPLREIAEEMGAIVNYNSKTEQITLIKGELSIQVQEPTFLVEGKTMVPLRMIGEGLGATVEWDEANNQINIHTPQAQNHGTEQEQRNPEVRINIKGYGQVTAELYPEIAPNTVNNFMSLAKQGFYDELIFHRVIEDFMIQGGCPLGVGNSGPGYTIEGEFTSNGYEKNTLLHTEGVLSMARSSDPNSAGSQFFIMTGASPHLDGKYAAFGKVTEGLDIIKAIQTVETDPRIDRPYEEIVIESIQVETYGVAYDEPTKFGE